MGSIKSAKLCLRARALRAFAAALEGQLRPGRAAASMRWRSPPLPNGLMLSWQEMCQHQRASPLLLARMAWRQARAIFPLDVLAL
jgi:hypothetical protein